ncbi:hypothetical protein BGZ76_001753 [Entomortierella beljakovae]|nr:hypothetical protein BGZ76_001753 [Entomortierella beljakovae]
MHLVRCSIESDSEVRETEPPNSRRLNKNKPSSSTKSEDKKPHGIGVVSVIKRNEVWNGEPVISEYISVIPNDVALEMTGFSNHDDILWLPRLCLTPSVELQREIFPFIESQYPHNPEWLLFVNEIMQHGFADRDQLDNLSSLKKVERQLLERIKSQQGPPASNSNEPEIHQFTPPSVPSTLPLHVDFQPKPTKVGPANVESTKDMMSSETERSELETMEVVLVMDESSDTGMLQPLSISMPGLEPEHMLPERPCLPLTPPDFLGSDQLVLAPPPLVMPNQTSSVMPRDEPGQRLPAPKSTPMSVSTSSLALPPQIPQEEPQASITSLAINTASDSDQPLPVNSETYAEFHKLISMVIAQVSNLIAITDDDATFQRNLDYVESLEKLLQNGKDQLIDVRAKISVLREVQKALYDQNYININMKP